MNWTGFLLCCGAYVFAVLTMWAFIYGATRNDMDDMTEDEWLEFVTSTPPNNPKNQQ